MADQIFPLDRRELMAGLGVAILIPSLSRTADAQARLRLALQARPGMAPLRPGAPDSPIWSLGTLSSANPRFKRGDQLEVTLENGLAAPVVMNWRGIDGVQTAEPLAIRAPLAAGAKKFAHGSAAPRRQLLVRPPPARRWSRTPFSSAAAGCRGKRAGRGRPRRSVSDRRLAAAAGWHRDRAGHRSQGRATALHHQRVGDAGHCRPPPRAVAIPVYQWLPTKCYCYQNRRPRGPRHGPRQPACRALPRARRRDRAGAG